MLQLTISCLLVCLSVGQLTEPSFSPPLTPGLYTTTGDNITTEPYSTPDGVIPPLSTIPFSTEAPTFPPSTATTERLSEPPTVDNSMVTNGVTPEYSLEDMVPKIVVVPRNVTVPVGGTAQFLCEATGYPNPHLVFVRADTDYILPIFSKESVDGRETISAPKIKQIIAPITELDQGWYTCIAANFYGTVNANVFLNVTDLCKDMECPGAKSCLQDYNAGTAECACPMYSCHINSDYAPVCGADCKIHFNTCVWNETSCENDYDVTGILAYGEECPEIIPPALTLLNGDMVLNEGDSFTLACAVEGFPTPTIEWEQIDNAGNTIGSLGFGAVLIISKAELSHSGQYLAKATNCETSVFRSGSVSIEVKELPEPTQPPPQGPVSVCNIFGDPHVYTFDKWAFHFSGECTYILSMDCQSFKWIIYGDFKPCGSGTCLDTITMFVDYKPIQLLRGWIININGQKRRFEQGKVFEIDGVEFLFDGLNLKGTILDAGVTIVWDGFVSLQIAADTGKDIKTCGICGNNDQDPDNEHLQAIKLNQRIVESMEASRYGNNWKVDRHGSCQLPAEVQFDFNEPCGSNFGGSLMAKAACQAFIENPALMRCDDEVDMQFYYHACLYDYCYLDLLREKNNLFNADANLSISPVCTIARAYAGHCLLKGISMRGWDVYMSCPIVEAQDAILSISCPQLQSPLIRS